ncbi:hypothetical protein [Pseudonocardia broussonetiae]|uniref:Uncharacterized protein n=1 Tax=Pseudonocardia broussonetiae TaxID=2736640 RepID=A0A6M6JR99_9PSEU|nr:hypothetical protein [Pseudonocardia broussonetiae]QJY48919.1 hypothetical protein HOP40_26670 [Pseudonocardia broussonetiae]
MSCGTLVLGLVLALVLDSGPEFGLFGWVVAALGAVGVALHFLMPASARSSTRRRPS